MSRYGASPLHLLAHGLAFALAGFALLQLLGTSTALRIAVWLVAAVVLHDFLLLPFYSALDRAAGRLAPGAAVNHVRVPAGISGVLLLVYLPGITGKGDPVLEGVSGRTLDGALETWLLITAALFAVSAAVYAARRQRRA